MLQILRVSSTFFKTSNFYQCSSSGQTNTESKIYNFYKYSSSSRITIESDFQLHISSLFKLKLKLLAPSETSYVRYKSSSSFKCSSSSFTLKLPTSHSSLFKLIFFVFIKNKKNWKIEHIFKNCGSIFSSVEYNDEYKMIYAALIHSLSVNIIVITVNIEQHVVDMSQCRLARYIKHKIFLPLMLTTFRQLSKVDEMPSCPQNIVCIKEREI